MALYLGAPQAEWDIVMSESEDLMHELGIGQHILGFYPIWDRVYGFEDAPLSVLCLVLGDPSQLLNPNARPKMLSKVYSVGRNGKVVFLNFFQWLKTICETEGSQQFISMFPFGDSLYRDSSVSGVLSIVEQIVGANPIYLKKPLEAPDMRQLAHERTRYVFNVLGYYAPCLNESWHMTTEPIEFVDPILKEQDRKLIKKMSTGDYEGDEGLWSYCISLGLKADQVKAVDLCTEMKVQLGEETTKFLKALL